jgi:hypothetical protein
VIMKPWLFLWLLLCILVSCMCILCMCVHASLIYFLRVNKLTFQAEAEEDIRKDIKAGVVVSYQCTSDSPEGIPIHPKIYRVRHDLTWKDVTENREIVFKKSVGGMPPSSCIIINIMDADLLVQKSKLDNRFSLTAITTPVIHLDIGQNTMERT